MVGLEEKGSINQLQVAEQIAESDDYEDWQDDVQDFDEH